MRSPHKKVSFECFALLERERSLGLSYVQDKAEFSKFPLSGKRSPFLLSYQQIYWVEKRSEKKKKVIGYVGEWSVMATDSKYKGKKNCLGIKMAWFVCL